MKYSSHWIHILQMHIWSGHTVIQPVLIVCMNYHLEDCACIGWKYWPQMICSKWSIVITTRELHSVAFPEMGCRTVSNWMTVCWGLIALRICGCLHQYRLDGGFLWFIQTHLIGSIHVSCSIQCLSLGFYDKMVVMVSDALPNVLHIIPLKKGPYWLPSFKVISFLFVLSFVESLIHGRGWNCQDQSPTFASFSERCWS